MEHDELAANAFVERYYRGDLSPDQEQRFEAHFFTCARCQEALESARDFRLGVRTVAMEDVARAARLSLLATVLRRRRWLPLLALLLVVAALPTVYFLNRPAPHADLSEPLAGVPVFLLSRYRDRVEAPPVTLDPARVGSHFALAVDAGGDPLITSYEARILDAAGREVYVATELVPNALEALMITFPARFFPPGDYRLVVVGGHRDGTPRELGGYAFRVASPP